MCYAKMQQSLIIRSYWAGSLPAAAGLTHQKLYDELGLNLFAACLHTLTWCRKDGGKELCVHHIFDMLRVLALSANNPLIWQTSLIGMLLATCQVGLVDFILRRDSRA